MSVERIGLLLLVVLAFGLPLELESPLLVVGPLGITNVELALYLCTLVGGVAWLRAGGRPRTAVHVAVTVWAGVILLSGFLSAEPRGLALKFALRSVGGCGLFFAVTAVVRSVGGAATVLAALAGGALVSAILGLAEVAVPGADRWLLAFKTQPSRLGGFLRASGSFLWQEYAQVHPDANIAAMYWEASVPMLMTLGVWWGHRRGSSRWRWGAMLGCGVLLAAIVSSASRAGLVVSFCVLGALLIVGLLRIPDLRAPAATALIGLVHGWGPVRS